MIAWRLFDLLRGELIHSAGLLLLVVLAAASGCRENREAGSDSAGPGISAGTPGRTDNPAGAAAATTGGEDAGSSADGADITAAAVVPEEPGTGGDGGSSVFRARGRARAGRDVDLARQAAAADARAKLSKLLKKNGMLAPSESHLEGAVIERYFRKGRYLYAVAAISLDTQPADLNVPRRQASKSTGTEEKTPRNPGNHGGKR